MWFGVDLRCRNKSTDHTELGTMRAEHFHCPCRGPEFQGDPYSWMCLLELRNHSRQQICAAHAGRHDRQQAGPRRAKLRDAKHCLRQDGFCSQHIVGEKLSGLRERTSPPPARDQCHTKLTLDVGDVLGHCRLADA